MAPSKAIPKPMLSKSNTFRRHISSLMLWLVFSSAQFTLRLRVSGASAVQSRVACSRNSLITLQNYGIQFYAEIAVMHLRNRK
jgi:hypothetical protein